MDRKRKEMVDDIIHQQGLAALIFWRPDELVMMLGYMPLWGVSILLYTADSEPVLYVPELEPEDLLPTGIRIEKFPWGVHDGKDPWEILYKEMKTALKVKGLSALPVSFIQQIGGSAPCRMSGEQPPLPADLIGQLSGLTNGGFNDVTEELLRLYQYKSKTDLEGLRLTHTVAARAVEVFYEEVKEGPTEARLAALIECAVQEQIGQHAVSFAKAWPMIQSGRNAADAGRYNRTTGKTIVPGELVLLEMGVCVNGYWADITRTALYGEPTDTQSRMFEAVSSAQQAAFARLRPGVAMREVDSAARTCIEEAGMGKDFNHALGHQTGFRYHDPGPVLSPFSSGVLQEGMVLTIEPGVYGPGLNGGLRIEDNVAITPDGHEMLSDYARDLQGKKTL